MRTQKTDWFNDLLAEHEGMLVSGHPSFAAAMTLPEQTNVALRFAANRRQIYGYFLTIECEQGDWESIKKILAESEQARVIYRRLEEIFQDTITVLLFAPKRSDIFSVSKGLNSFNDVDEQGLVSYFRSINPDIVNTPGTRKTINKSSNDGFQDWTGSNLSTYLTVNDFDAIATSYSKRPYFFELKRVVENIDTWEPYLDDQSNYAALLRICTTIKADLRVIAYQNTNTEYVALHFVSNATATQIDGRRLVCRANQIIGTPLGISYISTKRREKR